MSRHFCWFSDTPTLQKHQNIFKHPRPNSYWFPKWWAMFSPNHPSRVSSLVGRQTPILVTNSMKQSYSTPGSLGRWREWLKPTVSQLVWLSLHLWRFLSLAKNVVLERSWKWMALTNVIGTDLETQLLEVRHMSRPKFFIFSLSNSISKPTFTNMCGLPLRGTRWWRLALENIKLV
jgi:hypothetical protein